MIETFHRREILDYDILTIQESYRNSFQHIIYYSVKERFHLLYFDNEDTRLCIFVNKRINSIT